MNHAQIRALERYGIKLELADLRQIAHDVICGKGVLLGRGPEGIERWLVKVQDRGVKLIYDPEFGKVITILPAHTKRPRCFYTRKAIKARQRKRARQTVICGV